MVVVVDVVVLAAEVSCWLLPWKLGLHADYWAGPRPTRLGCSAYTKGGSIKNRTLVSLILGVCCVVSCACELRLSWMRSCLVLSGESNWGLDFVATAHWLCGGQKCHHSGRPLLCFLVYYFITSISSLIELLVSPPANSLSPYSVPLCPCTIQPSREALMRPHLH